MDNILITNKVWNDIMGEIPKLPYGIVKATQLTFTEYPIKEAIIGTNDFNNIFQFENINFYPYFYFKICEDDSVFIEYYSDDELFETHKFKPERVIFKPFLDKANGGLDFELLECDDALLDIKGVMTPHICKFVISMWVLIACIYYKIINHKIIREHISGQEGQKRKKSNSKKENSNIIRIDDITIIHEYGRKNNGYERHTDGWEVRGHLRKCKSGKTVFIKSYSKGKVVSNYKTYLLKDGDA